MFTEKNDLAIRISE